MGIGEVFVVVVLFFLNRNIHNICFSEYHKKHIDPSNYKDSMIKYVTQTLHSVVKLLESKRAFQG